MVNQYQFRFGLFISVVICLIESFTAHTSNYGKTVLLGRGRGT